MTKQDWIILRLLRASAQHFLLLDTQAQNDYSKAALYLVDKYGLDAVFVHCDQLVAEKTKHETN